METEIAKVILSACKHGRIFKEDENSIEFYYSNTIERDRDKIVLRHAGFKTQNRHGRGLLVMSPTD